MIDKTKFIAFETAIDFQWDVSNLIGIIPGKIRFIRSIVKDLCLFDTKINDTSVFSDEFIFIYVF
ncbi:MAG: hypothetical protein PF518_13665 [Spirochaetaceae bacterium]|nr:hypothetical protein [Spirochaetaceae bacterium]